jgi:hypothetical protein
MVLRRRRHRATVAALFLRGRRFVVCERWRRQADCLAERGHERERKHKRPS